MNDRKRVSDIIMDKIEAEAATAVPHVAAWLKTRLASRWYPRNRHAARDFVIRTVADQPFFLYGAGSHSLALLEDLSGHEALKQLQGFLDGHARPGQMLGDYPVFPKNHALATDHLIILSHHEFEDGMMRDLLALGVDHRRIRPIYADPEYGEMVLARLWPELEARVAELEQASQRVVFVNARKRRMIDGPAIAACGAGLQIINIGMDRDTSDASEDGFDACFDARNSLFLCCRLLELLKPQLVVVQEHYSSGNFLPLVLGLFLPPDRVVAEFYDFLALTFDDPAILARESYWSNDDVALALAAERWCCQHLAGMITKEDGPVLDGWLRHPKVLKYQPCFPKSAFCVKQPEMGDPPRLIWAGTIASSRLSPVMFGDNQLLDVFADLLAAGFAVTARTSCGDQAELKAHYGDYLELAQNPRFRMLTAVPKEQLIPEMAATQDFGLMLGRPKPQTQQGISHRVTVSAKLHAYLAAGLPVIVGDYLEVMAGWVREQGIGLVIAPDRIADLPAMIEAADYGAMLEAVRAYREKYQQQAMANRLRCFMDDLLKR